MREIAARRPRWLARAEKQTNVNRTAGRFVSKSDFWSEVKPIFVAHQREKCAYCERKLTTAPIDWDLEHYRPKGGVDAWTPPAGLTEPTGCADERGYFLLAFDPQNYLVACKPCNTIHKGNFFPVAGNRMILAADVAEARSEDPYILNPLDPNDPPPEQLIGFDGILPQCMAISPQHRARAMVTIEVLGLGRAELELPRAKVVMDMWGGLKLLESIDPAARQFGEDLVESRTGDGSEFASCARCFSSLFMTNRPKADLIGGLATKYVKQHSK